MRNGKHLVRIAAIALLTGSMLFHLGCDDDDIEYLIKNYVAIVATDASASEATPSDTAKFKIYLSADASEDLTVTLSINTGTSGGPEDGDFTLSGATLGTGSTSATVVIPEGDDEATITLTAVTGDGDVENENVVFTITAISNTNKFKISSQDDDNVQIVDNGINPAPPIEGDAVTDTP